MPEIDDVIEAPFDQRRARALRALAPRPQAALAPLRPGRSCCPNTFSPRCPLLWRASPFALGFVGESRYGLLNLVHQARCKAHAGYGGALRRSRGKTGTKAGAAFAETRLRIDAANSPSISAGRASRAEASSSPSARRRSTDRPKPLAGRPFLPSSRRSSPRWATPSGSSARERTAPIGEEIAVASEGAATDLCGRTDLASAIDLLSLAEVVVSNDSGPHARRRRRRASPVVALYGSSSPEAHAALARAFRMSDRDRCSPCSRARVSARTFPSHDRSHAERVMEGIAAFAQARADCARARKTPPAVRPATPSSCRSGPAAGGVLLWRPRCRVAWLEGVGEADQFRFA